MSSQADPIKVYAVVEFDDGLSLVPVIWLFEDNKKCYFPSYSNQYRVNKDISKMRSPERDWKEHKVVRLFCFAESYEQGMEKLKMAQEISDLESESEIKSSRHTRHISKHIISDSDDESDVESILPSLPKRPKVSTMLSELKTATSMQSGNFGHNTNHCLLNKSVEVISSSQTLGISTPTRSVSSPCTLGLSNTPTGSSAKQKIDNSDFQRLVLNKLNTIIQKVNMLEKYVLSNKKDENKNVYLLQEVDTVIPIKSLADLKSLDTDLSTDEDLYNKILTVLKLVGGGDLQNVVSNIMKRIISNGLGAQCSLKGKKKKEKFITYKNIIRLIIESVRYSHKNAMEQEINKAIALWLTQCPLRLSRNTAA